MSIVSLVKVTVLGLGDDKASVLCDLQAAGCLHLVPLYREGERDGARAGGPSAGASEALKFLFASPVKRRQIRDPSKFDAESIERLTLELQRRLLDLEDQRDLINRRLVALEPWGEFEWPPLTEMAGQRLWFYVVPHYQMKDIPVGEMCYEVVNRDQRFCYVVVIATDEPAEDAMPVARTHTGARSVDELEERLDEVENAIADARGARESLTRWCLLFAQSLDRLEDNAARDFAAEQTLDVDPLFALQGWAPSAAVPELLAYARDRGLALDVREPTRDDAPPTLMSNPPAIAGGEDLVTFYMTPGYFTWDPSQVVFYSFALFFAMILADAGYAALLALVLAYYWRTMSATPQGCRLRNVFAALVGATFAYGVLSASYFGIDLPADSVLRRVQVLDITDATSMMFISVLIGVFHVGLASVMDAWRQRDSSAAFAPLGWVALIVGALLLAGGMKLEIELLAIAGETAMVLGALAVLAFTGAGEPPLRRLISGVLGLTKVTSAFGDVMSYLRLFALGLASASLAAAFNGMAMELREGRGGVGILLALLVLIVGHGLNLVLGLMSAVVHGLRLNVIEFFNWGIKEEGLLFRPFKRKERTPWNPSS